jgi:hypothetical protein
VDGRIDAGEETGEEEVTRLDLSPETDAERIARLEHEIAHILAQSKVTMGLAQRYKQELHVMQKRCASLEKKLARRSAKGAR